MPFAVMKSHQKKFRRAVLTGSILPAVFVTSAVAADWSGAVSLVNNPSYNEGLREGQTATNNDFTTPIGSANPGPNGGESLTLRMGQSNAFGADAWGDNKTWIYSGEVFTGPNGIISLAAENDDTDRFVIDGAVVLQDTAWNIPNAVVVSGLTPNSWVTFDYRVANGAGGAGPSGQNPAGSSGWNGTTGVVMSYDNENNSLNVSDYLPGGGGLGLGKPEETAGGGPTLFRYTLGGGLFPDNINIRADATVTMSGAAVTTAENVLRFLPLDPPSVSAITLTVNSADTDVRTLQASQTFTAWKDGSTAIFSGNANIRVGQARDGTFVGNFIRKNGGTGELIFDNSIGDLDGTILQVVDGLVSIKGNGFNPLSTLGSPIEMNGVNARLRFGPLVFSNVATTFANSIVFNETGTLEHPSSRIDTIAGSITIGSGKTVKANITGGTLRLAGSVFATTGSIEKTGAGTFAIGDQFSTSTIPTASVSAGKLAFSGNTTFGTVPTILPGGTLSLNGPPGTTYVITSGTLAATANGTLELYPSVGTLQTNLTGGTLMLNSDHGLNGEFWNAAPNNVAAASGGTFNSLWDPRPASDPDASTNTLRGGVGSANGTNVPGNGVFTDFQNTFAGLGGATTTAISSAGGVQEFNFPSTDGAPFSAYGFNAADNIQARWTGVIFIPTEGVYGFSTTSDDGSALFIDGASVVNNNRFQGMTNRGGSVFLTAGLHDIVFGFYEGGGGAGIQVFITPPGGTNQFLGNTNLFPSNSPASFTNPIDVQENSTINTAYFSAVASQITVQNGKQLTTTGNQLTVGSLKLRNTGGVYTINTVGTGNVLIATAIDDNSGTNITINKTGDGVFVLDNTTTPQLTNAASVININGGGLGVLLQTGGLNPTGNAAINFGGGGLVLSSKGGNQTFNLPTTFGGTNPAVEARKIGSGVAGPITIALNGNLKIPTGQVLGLKTADNYLMTIGGTADLSTGVGTVSVNGGRINAITANALTGLNIAFGTPSGVSGTLAVPFPALNVASLGGGKQGIANLIVGDGVANSTLTINQSITTEFGGNIKQEGATVVSVVKQGTGTLGLSGMDHNYSGGLTISAGTVVTNGQSLGTGLLTLNGGTLVAVSNGLLGEYWDSTKGGDGGAQAGFGSNLATFNAYFDGKGSAILTAPTTTAGRQNLRFSTGSGLDGGGFDPGSPFADQGFTPDNNIAARLSGNFFASVAGNYTFLTRSDDGSVLFIDGVKVVDNNFYQGMTNRNGNITLTAGNHTISVGFYEGGGGAGLEVRYTPPGGTDQFITNDLLTFGGLTATNNVLLQTSSTIDPSGGLASFGALSTAAGRILTGLAGSISFTGTTLTSIPGGVYEFNKSGSGALSLGAIVSNGATNPVTIRKTGDGTLLLGVPVAAQLTNATDVVSVIGGQVVAVSGNGGMNPLGQSTVQLGNGTSLGLSTAEASATFANAITISGNAGVSAGNFGFGAIDAGIVTLSSPLTVTLPNTLTLNSKNGYVLNLNTISGGGNVTATGGTVNAAGPVTAGAIVANGKPTLANVYDTTLNLNNTVTAASLKVEAGAVVKQTGPFTTTGDTTIDANAEFQVNGGTVSTNVNLNGGILRAQTGVSNFGNRTISGTTPTLVQDALRGVLDLTQGGLAPNNDGGILSILLRKPDATTSLTGPLAITNDAAADAAFGTLFSSPAVTGGQTFTAVFFGTFTAQTSGLYSFQSGTVDDNGAFWVDLNRNGIFETAGSAGNELLSGQGCCGDGPVGTATLVAGQTYNVAFGVEDTGGNSGYTARFKRPADAALITVNPTQNDPGGTSQLGVWAAANPLASGVIIEAGAEIAAARVSNATVALTGAGAKLTLNSPSAVSDVTTSLAVLLGPTPGASTLEVGANNTLTATALTIGNDATLIKTGAGTLNATTQSLGARVLDPLVPALQIDAGIVNLNGAAEAFAGAAQGASNSGGVLVNGGTLNVNGSISGAVTVNAGGRLGGTGIVGATTINGTAILAGVLAPGNSAGTLTTGTLLLTSNAKVEFELGVGAKDLITVNGDLTLDGALRIIELTGIPDGTYRLMDYTGLLTDNGLDLDPTFLAIHPGSTISTATATQVNLVVIPEPGSLAALFGGIGLLAGLRRFRRS